MTEPKIHAGHIEVACAHLIGFRTNTIVPNVSWGLYLRHECDMLVLDQQNRFTEVEIKCTASDLKADFKKTHGHESRYITRLIYAMPEKLCDKYANLIPKECGIISVSWSPVLDKFTAEWHRTSKHRKIIEKVPEGHIKKFMQLGCMRIWSLKEHNNKPKKLKYPILLGTLKS